MSFREFYTRTIPPPPPPPLLPFVHTTNLVSLLKSIEEIRRERRDLSRPWINNCRK